jgi:hypothetical protein
MNFFKRAVLVTAGAVALSASAFAEPITGVSFSGGGTSDSTLGYAYGWEFEVSDNITVTSLGAWDAYDNGFAADNNPIVGIWSAAGGAALATATVTATVGDKKNWDYADIGPLDLSAGNYIVAAYFPTAAEKFLAYVDPTSNDSTIKPSDSVSFVGGKITYVHPEYLGEGLFYDYADLNHTYAAVFANFQYTVASAPVSAPGAAALLALGIIGIVANRRKKIA